MKENYKLYYAIFFCLSIFAIGICTAYASKDDLNQLIFNDSNFWIVRNRDDLENIVNSKLALKNELIDIYGFSQRLMMKNEVGNFDVIKDKEGFLHRQYPEKSEEDLMEWALNLQELYNYSGGGFLFVQAPSDYVVGVKLPLGLQESTNSEIDIFHSLLQDRDIPYVDGRNLIWKLDGKPAFYKTDHHWTIELCLLTFQDIVGQLNSRYGLNLDSDKKIRDMNNYKIEEYSNSFLGSAGIRTGKLYAGQDDFRIFVPKFKTDFEYEHYVGGELSKETKGSFSEAFIDKGKLEKSYKNKYNAFMQGGYYENIIRNNLADNEKKLLLIGDSFSRPLSQYLSLCFKETRYLDPQEGRYNESYVKYMERYNPDVVLVVINGAGIYYPMDLSR